jgi:hypothetical protein
MAKTIDDAIALLASGKSQRECEKLTGIPRSTIDREAKKRGIAKGSMGQLISDKVRVESEIGALSEPMQLLVNAEVIKQLDGMDFYATNARKVIKVGIIAYSKAPSPMGMKTVIDGMKSAMQVEGLVPFHPSSAAITNNNANQVVVEPIRFTRASD